MFAEDLSVFFNPATPGVFTATIAGTSVNGSLEDDLDETLEGPTVRNAPLFMCAKAALPAVVVGTVVAIGATNYVVRSVEVDEYDPVAVLHLNNP